MRLWCCCDVMWCGVGFGVVRCSIGLVLVVFE